MDRDRELKGVKKRIFYHVFDSFPTLKKKGTNDFFNKCEVS